VTVFDKTIIYHGQHLTEKTEPRSFRKSDTPPSVNPVDSVRDTLKGGSHERRPMHGPIGIDLKESYE